MYLLDPIRTKAALNVHVNNVGIKLVQLIQQVILRLVEIMETSSKIRKLSEIIDKYRVHNRLYCGPMSKKMICVRLYAAAASGTRSVDIIKKMVGDAPMEEYLLPEDYENWKRLISES